MYVCLIYRLQTQSDLFEDELFETDLLDDIESGAIIEKIELVYTDVSRYSRKIAKRKREEATRSFPCRYGVPYILLSLPSYYCTSLI